MDVEPADWMVPIDHHILSLFDTHALRLSAVVIAVNIDYERHYTSRRCQILKNAGLLARDEHGLYVLSEYGRSYLDGDVNPTSIKEDPPSTYRGHTRANDRDAVFAENVLLMDRVNFKAHDIIDVTWGYIGHGPLDLARALLADVYDGRTAQDHANAFMKQVVATLPEKWELSREEIKAFVEQQESD